MNYTVLIISFLMFSFIGWIMDSVFSTLYTRKITNSGYFQELPLCPMYGVGGLALYFTTVWLFPLCPWYITIGITGMLLSVVEYIGGWFCVYILKERLWDYSDKTWNLHGHIDILHAIFWMAITAFFYFYLFPKFMILETAMNDAIRFPDDIDRTILVLFLCGTAILTYTRRKKRLQTLANVVMKKTSSFSRKVRKNISKRF